MIQEQTLERLVQCPLMRYSPPPEEAGIRKLLQWVLRQSFEGKFKGEPDEILHTIRGKGLDFWTGETGAKGRLIRVSAFRMFNLILDYEVVHLEQPYNLIVSGYTIQGTYALLKSRKGACLPHVLVDHLWAPALLHDQSPPPDVPTMARFLHVLTTTPYKNARVLHYPVLEGRQWVKKGLNVTLAQQYLESMLKIASLRPDFPVMGEHCSKCPTKPCMEVFNGQDDDSR